MKSIFISSTFKDMQAEREMMKFFRELILMGKPEWMQEFLMVH